jgi:hypothetical protein
MNYFLIGQLAQEQLAPQLHTPVTAQLHLFPAVEALGHLQSLPQLQLEPQVQSPAQRLDCCLV